VQTEKLAGAHDAYRLRVGDYRVLYTIDDRIRRVVIYRIAHRRESYR
jgi:mRNA interferase RelE/StbE